MKKDIVKTYVPNIVMWAWMRTVLNLTGAELLIFSYVFSQTFDDIHKCYTCLSDMESWFGLSRQTISRNIDKLCAKGFVEKETLQDNINPMIKHNNYKVCVSYITKLCENSDFDNYNNFLESYGSILKQKFPDDVLTIDEYLKSLSTWHQNKDIEVCITLNEIAQLICFNNDNHPDIISMLDTIRNKNKSIKKSPEKSFIDKKSDKKSDTKKSISDIIAQKPKRVSNKAKKEEWNRIKREMTNSFIYMKIGGNEELFDLLNKFLDTDNGRNYTPAQWEQQLDNLYENGRTVERMISGVKTSYMNNYRALYIADKSEIDIDLKLHEIDEYVKIYADDNDELREYLQLYVTEVPKGKSYTIKQFKLALNNLSMICKSTDDKIKSVKNSYANSYSALAYANNYNDKQSEECIDTDEKIKCIKNFIADGYYYLCAGLEDSLLSYINTTKCGKSMSVDNFKIMLNNLRLYCLDDSDKVAKVQMAIQNNSNKFATEDFDETRQIKNRLQTREGIASHLDRSRKLAIIKEKNKNPNNEILKNVIV